MKKKSLKGIELFLPQGYTFEELYETDDAGYGLENEAPAYKEEVKLRIEREQRTKPTKRI